MEIGRVDLCLWVKDGAALPVPAGGIPVTVTLPDGSQLNPALTAVAVGEDVPLLQASVADLHVAQATGTFVVEAAGGALAPQAMADLPVVLTGSPDLSRAGGLTTPEPGACSSHQVH